MQWAQIRGAREEAVALGRLPAAEAHHEHAVVWGLALAATGDRESARTRMATVIEKRFQSNDDLRDWSVSSLAMVQAISGETAAALASAAELERLIPDAHAQSPRVFRARLASIYAWAGDKDRALRELTGLLREPGVHFKRLESGDDYRTRINVHELRTSLEFSPLQGDPRFEALLNDPKNNAPLF